MNRGRIFRHRFDTRMDRLQTAAEHLENQMEKVRDQAREGLERGRDALVSIERSMVRNVRDNPALYLVGGLVLLGLLLAKISRDRRERRASW